MEIHDGNRPLHQAMTGFRDEVPGWVPGLRQLYQVVAEAPIPTDFSDLLASIGSKSGREASH